MASWQAAPARASATPLPAAPFTPVPANPVATPARAAESTATRAHPFAELLRQSRDDGVVHEQIPPSPRAEESSFHNETDEPPSTPTTPMKAKPRMAPPTPPKTASSAHASDPEERIRNDKEAGGSQAAGSSASAVPDDAHADGWIAQALASGASPTFANDRADGARRRLGGADPDADSDATQADLAATGPGPRSGRTDARSSARADANDARLAARADADAATRTQMLPAAFAEAFRASDAAPHRASAETPIDALAPSLAAGGSSPTGEVPAATASTELSLPTPIDSPDFGADFGVQVSVLAKDGVQQAELHLNPAETGPVSIQIALDGSEARIDFGADLAATRAAIERSLPELAAALRNAGFTLTGGGVSSHAGGHAPSGDDDGSSSPRPGRRVNAADDGPVTALPGTRRFVAGGVDLYA